MTGRCLLRTIAPGRSTGLGLHRLRDAHRKAYRHQPALRRPVTEEAALHAVAFAREGVPQDGRRLGAGVQTGMIPCANIVGMLAAGSEEEALEL
jgi:hypothetical protein